VKSWSTKLDRQAVLGEGDRACGTTPSHRMESVFRSCRGFIEFQSRANSIKPQSSEYLLSGGAWKRDKGGQLIPFIVSLVMGGWKIYPPFEFERMQRVPSFQVCSRVNNTVRLLKRISALFVSGLSFKEYSYCKKNVNSMIESFM